MITARTMADLLNKVYKRESWQRQAGESRTARVKTKYDLELDYKKNIFVAKEKNNANQ